MLSLLYELLFFLATLLKRFQKCPPPIEARKVSPIL
jgi:hypothetical protein